MTDLVALTVKHRYSASAERVFDAWLDPDKAGRFLFATPTGRMIKVEIDARVGGRFVFVDRRPEGDAEHFGAYLEIDRPRRLVFDFWVPQYADDRSRVVIEIAPLAEGGCELTLSAEVLEAYRDRSVQGWTMILEALDHAIG